MRWLGIGLVAVIAGALGAWVLLSLQDPGKEGREIALSSTGDADPPPIAWSHRVQVASGEAVQGPWRMNESDFRYVDAPTVALGADGSAAVAWVDQARKDVFFQWFHGDGEPRFPEAVNVSRSPRVFSWLPRIALGPPDSGEVHLLWQEIIFSGGSHGGEILHAHSLDGGASFDTPVNLSNTPAGAGKGRVHRDSWHNGSLDLVRAPDGTLHVAWTEYEGALRVTRSTDGGETFSDPVAVAGTGEGEPARGPSLAVGPDGSVLLAWTVGEDPRADIRVARSGDGGMSFGDSQVVAPGPEHADAPKVAVDGGGGVHLVYHERSQGPSGPYRIRYTRAPSGDAPSGGGAFQEPRSLHGPESRVEEGGGVEGGGGFPSLAVDGEGRIHLLWELFPEPDGRPRGLAMAVSYDGGHTFSSPVLVPGAGDPDLGFQGSLQGLLMRKLDVDDEGKVAVVNSTFDPGDRSRVFLFRGQLQPPDPKVTPGEPPPG